MEIAQQSQIQQEMMLKDLFSRRENLLPLLISMMLMFGQQLSGVSAMMFYTPKIFNYTGTHISGNFASIIMALVQVVATAVSTSIMDRVGRRSLLILSALVMALSAFIPMRTALTLSINFSQVVRNISPHAVRY